MHIVASDWSPEAVVTRVRTAAQREIDDAVKASLVEGKAMSATIAENAVQDFLKMIKSAGRLHSANVAVPAVETLVPNGDGTVNVPFLSRVVKVRGPRKPKPTADTTAPAADTTPSA